MYLFCITGELITWALNLHGIERNPNDEDVSSSFPPNAPDERNFGGVAEPSRPGDFDGSENSIVAEPSRKQNPPLAANAEVGKPSVSILSASAASSSSLPASSKCAKLSVNGQCLGWCLFLVFSAYFTLDILVPSVSSCLRGSCCRKSSCSNCPQRKGNGSTVCGCTTSRSQISTFSDHMRARFSSDVTHLHSHCGECSCCLTGATKSHGTQNTSSSVSSDTTAPVNRDENWHNPSQFVIPKRCIRSSSLIHNVGSPSVVVLSQ